MMFDTHIHLDRFPDSFNLDDELVAARRNGVGYFLVPGVDRTGWKAVRDVVGRTEGGLAAYGLHPTATADWDQDCRAELLSFLRDSSAIAVGEVGLDRYVDVPAVEQERVFREQVQIAIDASLPLLIHCRKKPGKLLEILKEEGAKQVGGIMHAFGGSLQIAEQAIELGFVLSFGGSLTYPEARRAVDVLLRIPAEAIVVETDAPDLAPHPHRGELNRPVWLSLVLERLAEIRGWSREQAATITSENARRVLRLD